MIRTEFYMTRPDGVRLVRTYSDSGFRIVQDGTGAVYDEAVDPEETGRTYTESDELVQDEITDHAALNILLGRDDNESE